MDIFLKHPVQCIRLDLSLLADYPTLGSNDMLKMAFGTNTHHSRCSGSPIQRSGVTRDVNLAKIHSAPQLKYILAFVAQVQTLDRRLRPHCKGTPHYRGWYRITTLPFFRTTSYQDHIISGPALYLEIFSDAGLCRAGEREHLQPARCFASPYNWDDPGQGSPP